MPKVDQFRQMIQLLFLILWLHLEIAPTLSATLASRQYVSGLSTQVAVSTSVNAVADTRGEEASMSRIRGGTVAPMRSLTKEAHLDKDSILQSVAISVTQNSLGDMNEDSIIDMLDLLRIRDIAIGFGYPPTASEFIEGDLDQDSGISWADVLSARFVLEQLEGVPYQVDASGGTLTANGVQVDIPPGAVESATVMSVTPITLRDLELESGVDLASEAQDQNWVMTAFRINADTLTDIQMPLGLTIRLDNVPPCSLRALNALYQLGPDTDGDGNPDVQYAGELEALTDSLALRLRQASVPRLAAVSASAPSSISSKEAYSIADLSLTVGKRLWLNGSGLNDDCVIHFVYEIDSVETVMPVMVDQQGYFTIVPPHPKMFETGGPIMLYLEDLSHGFRDTLSLDGTISWPALLPPNPESTIHSFFALLDTVCLERLNYLESDTLLQSQDRTYLASLLSEGRSRIPALRDTILSYPAIVTSRVASVIIESGVLDEQVLNSQGIREPLGCYTECWHEALVTVISEVVCQTVVVSTCAIISAICGVIFEPTAYPCFMECYHAFHLVCVGHLAYEVTNVLRCFTNCVFPEECKATYYLDPNPKKDYFCTNVFRHRGKVCVKYSGYPGGGSSGFGGSSSGPWAGNHGPGSFKIALGARLSSSCCGEDLAGYSHPLKGAIVSADKRLPFGAYARIDGSGGFQLPGLPEHSTLTLRIYDPKTGLYDNNVASVVTGSDYDQNVIYRPVVFFNPDTSTIIHTLQVGDLISDSVVTGSSRIQYRVPITPSMTGQPVNIGFSSDRALTLWIQDPTWQSDSYGGFKYRDSLTACTELRDFVPDTPGVWLFTITYGALGGDGRFTVGVNYAPYPPIPQLCGTIPWDTLYSIQSPYFVAQSASVAANDTLNVQPGVSIEFYPGGSISSSGVLKGTGSIAHPIRLRPGTGSYIPPITRRDEKNDKRAEGDKR